MNTEQLTKDYRAAIERELQERLASDGCVRLRCLQCQGLNAADAQFCSSCGTKFNAVVAGTA